MTKHLILASAITIALAGCSTPTPSAIPQGIVATSPEPTGEVAPVETAVATPVPTPEVTPVPTPEPTAEPTPAPPKPVIVKGTGSRKTKPFTLPLNDYSVVVKGTCKDTWGSNVIVELYPVGGDILSSELLFNEIAKHGKYKYDTEAYGLGSDEEKSYIDATMCSGAWIVTFTPQ